MLPFARIIDLEGDEEFLQCALNYINDSYRSPVYVYHSGEAVAVAALFMASRKVGVGLPERSGREWWRLVFFFFFFFVSLFLCFFFFSFFFFFSPNLSF